VPEEDSEQRDAGVSDAKDALDVVIAHQRAELDRLQRRLDRVDTRLAAVVTGGVAFAALVASVLAAQHSQIELAAIVSIGIGGVCIGSGVLLCLFGSDPRLRGNIWLLSQAGRGMRAVRKGDVDWLVESTDKMKQAVAMMRQAGAEMPDFPGIENYGALIRYAREVFARFRRFQEDRQIAILELDLGALEVRRSIASTLAARLVFLEQLVDWRELLARIATLLLSAGVLTLTGATVITIA
jgi:hypothetical protein